MRSGCQQVADIDVVEEENRDEFCSTIRGEPQYVDGGEDDRVIVEWLTREPSAFGIFGYSFAAENPEMVATNPIDGVTPTAMTIADGSYPLARPFYIYVKTHRIDDVPMLKEMLVEYASEAAIGPGGYLVERGLVPLSEPERAESIAKVNTLIGN